MDKNKIKNKIIDFEEILNKKDQEYRNIEEGLNYKEDEYSDLLSLKEITELIDLSQELEELYINFKEELHKEEKQLYKVEDVFELIKIYNDFYNNFTKKLIKNYIEYKYPCKYPHLAFEYNDDNKINDYKQLTNENLEDFRMYKIINASSYIKENKSKGTEE